MDLPSINHRCPGQRRPLTSVGLPRQRRKEEDGCLLRSVNHMELMQQNKGSEQICFLEATFSGKSPNSQ